MTHRPGILSGALRLTAIAAGIASVVGIMQESPGNRVSGSPDRTTAEASTQMAEGDTAPGTWSLRAGGWYIRVDGAEIDIPTFTQQTTIHPRTSQAVPISPFDQLIVYHAQAEGFDWRLIAALIFEESRFDPTSESDKGAYGLMQVRPIAAEAVGAERFKAPDDNVQAGVRYLRQLDGMFNDAKDRDRMGLVLAAYNMGPGHIRDAQMLARRFGFDPNRWEDNMDRMLPLLEQPSIYTYLPNGFAKGRDTVAYVQRTIERYQRYRRDNPGAPGTDAGALSSSANGSPASG
jgi:soluble lytic murein transglycosylase-like protein